MQLVPAIGEGSNGRVVARVRSMKGLYGLNQTVLAHVLGIAQPQMSRRLRGTVPFSLGEVDALADFFSTSPGYLLGYEDGPSPKDPHTEHPDLFDGSGPTHW